MARNKKKFVIISAGGHGRVVGDSLLERMKQDKSSDEFLGWIDRDFDVGTIILGRPVLGDDEDAARLIKEGEIDGFIIGLGKTSGERGLREKLFHYYCGLGLEPISAIHPNAIIGRDVEIGVGVSIMAGVVINVGCKIGSNAIINTSSSIDHDANIAQNVHIAPGAVLSGDVEIGESTHVGTGANIRHGITIGEGVTIGVGAVVISNIANGKTAIGVPAKPI